MIANRILIVFSRIPGGSSLWRTSSHIVYSDSAQRTKQYDGIPLQRILT